MGLVVTAVMAQSGRSTRSYRIVPGVRCTRHSASPATTADPSGAVLEEVAEGLGLPFAVVLDPPDLAPHAGDRGEVVVAVVADLRVHALHPRSGHSPASRYVSP